MASCTTCRHYRRVKPPSELLAQAVATTDIAGQLSKIQEDESQQRGQEAEARMYKERAEDETWDMRPMMSPFCGLREYEDVYLIAELKNRGGRCPDHAEGTAPSRSCVTCMYRAVPEGWKRDLANERTFAGMASQAVSAGQSSSTADSLLGKYREGAGATKAAEVFGAYSARGVLARQPHYLDYCTRFSRPEDDEYVVCVLRNPHRTCAGWAAGPTRPPDR